MTLHRISVFSFREVPNQKTIVKYVKEENLQYVSIKLTIAVLYLCDVGFSCGRKLHWTVTLYINC